MTSNHIPDKMCVPRFLGEGQIEFVEKPVPEPASDQLLIESKANALCGSDLGQFAVGTEVTPGHEPAGVVAAAGPATDIPVGTAGVVFVREFCGQCRNCKLGLTSKCLVCSHTYGFSSDGGYGAYMLVKENVFFPVDADLDLAEATLLLDVMGACGHAIKRGQLLHRDIQSLLVTGAGPMGLGVLTMAKLLLGKDMPVLISDLIPYRLALAERLGALPINIEEMPLATGLQRHGFSEVDMAIEASGNSTALRAGLDVLSTGGVQVCLGEGTQLTLKLSADLIGSYRAIIGSSYFCYHEFPENLRLLRANREYLSQLITHRYPVAQIQQAFETFIEGDTGKVVVEH